MKQQIASLVAGLGIVFAINASAQTTAERVGAATGRYYGAVVFLKLLSDSRCSSSLKIGRDEYDLSRVKADIKNRIARFVTKDEMKNMSQFFSEMESGIRKDFTAMLNNANPDMCRQLVSEFSEMYYKDKNIWRTITK